MNSFLTFLKKPTTITGIVIAIVFQLVFGLVWMSGYSGVSDRFNQLNVGIVALDQNSGPTIAEQLQKNLPFKTELIPDETDARTKLDTRALHMLVIIPMDFTEQLRSGQHPAGLQFVYNESNPSMIRTIMKNAANTITTMINAQATLMSAQSILTQLKMPKEQIDPIAVGMAQRVAADETSIHPVKDVSNQMIPMMMVLASYVGAMIMGMNIQISVNTLQAQGTSKWTLLINRSILNIVSALIITLIGAATVMAMDGAFTQGFLTFWLFEAFFMWVFMLMAQWFLIAFGNAGMLFNIIALSVQLVTSGAIIPRELINTAYHNISNVMPATYAVQGLMNVLYGGPSISEASTMLLAITGTLIVLTIVVVAIPRGKKIAIEAQQSAIQKSNA